MLNINIEHVNNLIIRAQEKIARFKRKIENIETRIAELTLDRDNVKALLDYVGRTDERKALLIDLFYYDGEYGMPEWIPDGIMASIAERCARRERSLERYTKQKERRESGIKFIEHDIELLKKVAQIDLRWGFYLDYTLIDD